MGGDLARHLNRLGSRCGWLVLLVCLVSLYAVVLSRDQKPLPPYCDCRGGRGASSEFFNKSYFITEYTMYRPEKCPQTCEVKR
jgi:hypothetical protein